MESSERYRHVPVYVPPYVPRPEERLSLHRMLMMYARDILSVFTVRSFRAREIRLRLLRRTVLVLNDPELVREAFVTNHLALQRKAPQLRQGFRPLLGDGLFASDGATWEARRPVVAHIVHLRNTPGFFPVMVDAALEQRAAWEKRIGGPPVDILSDLGGLGAEIVSRALFGTALGREHAREVVEGLSDFQRHMDRLNLPSLLKLPDALQRLHGPRSRRAVRRIHAVIDGLIDRLMDGRLEGDARRSFVAQMLRAHDPEGRPFDREAIRNEAMVTFLAGYETTANTVAWAIYMLSRADWAREAIQEEIDTVLDGRAPRPEDIQRLVYTRAVVEETLRLYPPVPLLGREAIGPVRIGETELRPGDQVVVAPWLLHRNPRLWERPDDFVPERFLPGEPRPGKYAYVPFSIGPRTCPGMMFGLTEAVVSLAVLMGAFTFRPASDEAVRPVSRGTLRPGEALPMYLRRRIPRPSAATATLAAAE